MDNVKKFIICSPIKLPFVLQRCMTISQKEHFCVAINACKNCKSEGLLVKLKTKSPCTVTSHPVILFTFSISLIGL